MTDSSAAELRRFAAREIAGTVHTEGELLERCATDMSMFRRRPRAVVRPRDEADLRALLAFAREHRVPLTPRGGGSNTGGAAISPGIVVLFDGGEQWSGISYDERRGEITAGPAVRHDELQRALSERGRMLPSDPSSGPLSRIGGNVATRASGPHALKHGAIDRYLSALRVITADGAVLETDRRDTIPAQLLGGIDTLGDRIRADAESRRLLEQRRSQKIASGYNLFAFLEDEAHLARARLFAGSVGTLALVTGIRLSTEPLEDGRTTVEVYFDSAEAAVTAADRAVELGAAACEFLNGECLRIVRQHYPTLQVPEAGALLLLEFTGPGHAAAAGGLARELGGGRADRGGGFPRARVSSDPGQQQVLWDVRKRLLFTVKNPKPGQEALSVVNDVGVPRDRLAELVRFAEKLFDRLGITAPIYGHAGSGNLHMRPIFDLTTPNVVHTVETVAAEIYGAVCELGGTITAEHGMGPLRAPYLHLEWPEAVTGYMRELKELFDPAGILNPGAVFPDAPRHPYRFVAD